MNEKDPTIDHIREVRHQISAELGHDLKRVVAFYAELEKKLAARFVDDKEPQLEPSVGRK